MNITRFAARLFAVTGCLPEYLPWWWNKRCICLSSFRPTQIILSPVKSETWLCYIEIVKHFDLQTGLVLYKDHTLLLLLSREPGSARGTVDAEIKDPSVGDPEPKCSLVKAWSRSGCSHACFIYCHRFLPWTDFCPPSPFTCIFPKSSASFSFVSRGEHRFLCGLAE